MKKAGRMASRIMSLFLALVMLCAAQDVTAFAQSEDSMDKAKTGAEGELDGDDWGLEHVRRAVSYELDNYFAKFNPEDYDSDEWTDMENIVAQAKLDISTADVEALNSIVPRAKSKLLQV